MRCGTCSACKHRWSRRARRPLCRMKGGDPFCCLYAALCPFTAQLLALLLPDLSKASFCMFSNYFSQQLKRQYGTAPVLLIAAGAGAQQKRSAYTVERFVEELRKETSNQVYDTIEKVEDPLSQMLKKYFQNPHLIIQLCQYPYIRT